MDRRHAGHGALRRGRASIEGQVYMVTFVTQGRRPRFRSFRVARAAAGSLADIESQSDARLLCWVLMPDHFHALLELGGAEPLERVAHRLKAGMARAANRALRRGGRLWSRAFHDHALRQDEDLLATARYVVANPIRAGLVRRVGDYPFWNAVWLGDSK
jgi:putative transposase